MHDWATHANALSLFHYKMFFKYFKEIIIIYTHMVFDVYNDSNVISIFHKKYDENISRYMAQICNHILFISLKYKCLNI